MASNHELGIIGLGKIGGNLARQAVEEDISVVGKDVEERPELEELGVTMVDDYATLAEELSSPRAVYLSLPAGSLIDNVISDLVPHLEEGDVVLDGGNSFFRDSVRREEELREEGVGFVDCGTSGGAEGARKGACFMVGGRDEVVEKVAPVLRELSVDGGFVHTGEPGSGHFVKLVHNGVEFGMLQAIGEGVELLEDGEFDVDLEEVFENWSNGSVVRSWLVELMAEGLQERDGEQEDDEFEDIPAFVQDTGEVNWLVQEAMNSETPIPVISQSVNELFKSRGEQAEAYRAIALMRHGFGGHPFGEDEAIAEKRTTSRLEKI